MEHKSDEETSEKQPADSPSKQGSKKLKSNDGASGKSRSSSESESNGETEKDELDTEKTAPSDKRKLDVKEQKYGTSACVGASTVSLALSPTKRKCTERHVVPSEKIEQGEKIKGVERNPEAPGVVIQGSPKRSPTIPGASALDVSQSSPKRTPTIHEASAPGVVIQGSPKHSPTIPRTSAAGAVIQRSQQLSPEIPGASAPGIVKQGSPKRSPEIPGTSTGIVMQGTPQRSPTKRTYKERHQSCNVDELAEKRLKESGYQSDSALDLRKGFKKQMPSSTQSLELDCQPTSSDKVEKVVERQPEGKCPTEINFSRYPETASSEVTSSDGGEEYVSSTSKENVESATGEVTSSSEGCQGQNIDDTSKRMSPRVSPKHSGARPKETAGSSPEGQHGQNAADISKRMSPKTSPKHSGTRPKETGGGSLEGQQGLNETDTNKRMSPRASPKHSGARPKDTAGGSRSFEYIQVSFPKFSPSKMFYGEPTIRRISPPQASGSSGGFKVPPPPPPIEEQDKPNLVTNGLESFFSIIVNVHAMLTAEEAKEQMRLEQEEKARKEKEQAENLARARALASETTRKLREREARLKEGGNKFDLASDRAIAGPSTSRDETTEHGQEGSVKVEASVDKLTTRLGMEEYKDTEPIAVAEDIPVAQSVHDENANVMEEGPSRSQSKDDNANKSEHCAIQTNREETAIDAGPSTSGVTAQGLQETPRSLEYLSLQQLVPEINEISLYDSLENVAIADSDHEDDNVDLQNT